MRKTKSDRAYYTQIIFLGLVIGVGLQVAQAWNAPTQAPTGGNVTAPVTTGNVTQYKSGSLGLGGTLGVNNNNALLYWQGGEGEVLRLGANNGVNMHIENINGTFRLVNHPWTAGLFSVDQSGNMYTSGKANVAGRIGSAGVSADAVPAGWGGGVSTWDVFAKASVRANTLCLGGSTTGIDTGDCRSAWPAAASGADNLGNHTATQNLTMGANSLCFGSDCRNAWPSAPTPETGNYNQKICHGTYAAPSFAAPTNSHMHSVPVPSGWTNENCRAYMRSMKGGAPEFKYQLKCLMTDGSFSGGAVSGINPGTATAGIPSTNCGW